MFQKMAEELKYRLMWRLGIIISMFLYFSGITLIYTFFRKVVFKKFRTIVLTYHRVRDDGKYSDISVTTKNLDNQLRYLKKNFDVIPLMEAVKSLQNGRRPKSDLTSISFDDGYKDNFSKALPVLKRHEIPATIFLVSDYIGKFDDMLNIKELNSMKSHHIEFGSHTVNHPILSDLDANDITYEIHRSKQDLEKLLQSEISLFAYPKGKRRHYNETAKSELRKAGYIASFTTENGALQKSGDIYSLKRIGIRNCPLFVFKVRVSGLYESRPVLYIRNLFNLI